MPWITLPQILTTFYWIKISKKKSDWLICPGTHESGPGTQIEQTHCCEPGNPRFDPLFLK